MLRKIEGDLHPKPLTRRRHCIFRRTRRGRRGFEEDSEAPEADGAAGSSTTEEAAGSARGAYVPTR